MLAEQLRTLDPRDTGYASEFTARLLAAAEGIGASDVHLQPSPAGLSVHWRLDGVLQLVGTFPRGEASDVVTRLKVLADLLTYRSEVPQEGRIRRSETTCETRVSTFPTIFGERAVIRLLPRNTRLSYLTDLALPEDLTRTLDNLLTETSGAIVVSGPAGSGKTTTVYACLRELARRGQGQRCLMTLEDPVEMVVEGAAQARVEAVAGFDFATGVRSLLRQDPDVILIGEIRDRPTAEAAFTASLTGHLVLSTFHAGSSAGGLARLSDLGVEPYLLRSGLRAMICQRLLRQLCACSVPLTEPAQRLGLAIEGGRTAVGCADCYQTGFAGRRVIAELLTVSEGPLATAILERRDANHLAAQAQAAGLIPLEARAAAAVAAGWTSPSEVRRVLGGSPPTPAS